MTREPTLSERILLAVAITALILWCLVVLVVALGFMGPSLGTTWAIRIGLLAAGCFITARLVRLGVRSWRTAIARPLPSGRSSRWLARQPGWRLAVGCWSLYGAPELGIGLWLGSRGHQPVATTSHIAGLVTSVCGACLVALLCRVLWLRQAENSRVRPDQASPSR
jgi:hypothetical protein